MSQKPKSLTAQLEELQEAATQLHEFRKIIDKICLIQFGKSASAIQKMIEKKESEPTDFEQMLTEYFKLDSDVISKDEFLKFICTDSTRRYLLNKLNDKQQE